MVLPLFFFFSLQRNSIGKYSLPPFKMLYESSKYSRIFTCLPKKEAVSTDTTKGPSKALLIYTNLFGDRKWWNGEEAPNHLKNIGCSHHNCYITYEKSMLKNASAVVFHSRDMPSADELKKISREKRPSNQYWGYFSAESPINNPNPEPLNGMFNLTMTYKVASDIFLPYRKFIKLDHPVRNNVNYALNKTKMAYWLVSNCGVRIREDVVRLLEKHGVQVDVGGGCKNHWPNRLQCSERRCSSLSDYKFYLAFENSYCRDYVTSKYFRNGFESNSIPIVLGGANYSNPHLAIPGSYINVQDFPSINKLAEYLLKVSGDDQLFNSYFKWRENYELVDWSYGWPFVGKKGWPCELCKIVQTRSPAHKVYHKLSESWSVINDCQGRDGNIKKIIERSS